jgi:hypothetical protein
MMQLYIVFAVKEFMSAIVWGFILNVFHSKGTFGVEFSGQQGKIVLHGHLLRNYNLIMSCYTTNFKITLWFGKRNLVEYNIFIY